MRGTRNKERPVAENPPVSDRDLVAGQGRQRGADDAGYDGRCRDAPRGAEQAAEAGRGWAEATSRWNMLRSRKVGGDQG